MAEDYPYALDLELVDDQGRKTGLFHVRAASAADFLGELREIDSDFGLTLGSAIQAVRGYSILKSSLGATPVAQGAPARRQSPPPPSSDASWDDAPPTCAHGPMRYIPAGTSRTGRPYKAFYACTADRNDPNRCKSVPA